MSTYRIIEFPSLDAGIKSYMLGKELFSSRSSCLGRSETNPTVSFMIFKDDVDQDKYDEYVKGLPDTCKTIEVVI